MLPLPFHLRELEHVWVLTSESPGLASTTYQLCELGQVVQLLSELVSFFVKTNKTEGPLTELLQ